MSEPHADDAFSRVLEPYRRRLRLIAFTHVAPRALLTLLVAADAAMLMSAPGPGIATAAVLASAGVALVIAWIVALVRTPSPDSTARILDREFGLGDRIVSARQFASEGDVVSRVIVAAARRRLSALPPAALTLSRPTRWQGAAIVLLLATAGALGAGAAHRGDETGTAADASAFIAGGGSLPTANAAAAAAPPGAGQRAAPQPAPSMPPVASRQAPGARPDGSPGTPRAPEQRGEQVTDITRPQPRGGGDGRAAGAAAAQGASAATPGKAADGPPAAAASRRADASSRSESGAASPAGSGGRGVGGGGTRQNGQSVAGAGGVSSTSPIDAAPLAASATAAPRVTTAELRRATQAAEAAIARERVPARLRSYLRDYYIAIGREAR